MPCWSFFCQKKKRQNKKSFAKNKGQHSGSQDGSGQRSVNTSRSFKEARVVPDLQDVSTAASNENPAALKQKTPCRQSWFSHCCQKVRNCLKRKHIRIDPDVNGPGADPSAEGYASPTPPKLLTVDDFVFHEVLGEGTSGQVLQAVLMDTGDHFAVKAVRKDVVLTQDTVEYIMLEKRVLTLARENPFLTHLYSAFQTKVHLFFVMEFLSGGDLLFHMKDTVRFGLKRTTFYAAEMVLGLQFLHSRGIVHRDLKLENVMLDRDGHIKIADFGLCKENMFGEARATEFCGTPAYISPEKKRQNKKSFAKNKGQHSGSQDGSGQRSVNTSRSFKEARVVPDLQDVSTAASNENPAALKQKTPCRQSWFSHCCQKVRNCLKRKSIHSDVNGPGADPSAEGYASPTPPKLLTVDDFVFHEVLGEGTSGQVLQAVLKDTGDYYAVKVVRKDVFLTQDTVEYIMLEKRVLTLARENPFLTHLYSAFQTKDHLFFVMEFLSGGDLLFHMKDKVRFGLKRTTFYAAEMVLGLQFLHSRGIVHRDLKLANVMLDSNGHIKIADFGLCKENMFGEARATEFCGTPAYISPELLLEQGYNRSVDWWAFGVMLYQMLTGKVPFDGCSMEELFESIKTGIIEYPSWMNKTTKDLLKKLLERDPSQRLGVVGNIRDHPFFKKIDWAALEKREVKPPFKPKVQKAPNDSSSIGSLCLGAKPCLPGPDEILIDSKDQAAFAGFTLQRH